MARPSGNWTQIEVVDTGDGDDTSKLKLDLTTDTLVDKQVDSKENLDVIEQDSKESKDFRPNRNSQKSQNAQELEDGSEEREDKTERKIREESSRVDSDNDDESERGNRPSRAQKRIKQLLTRDREKDRIIQELQRQLHATSRVAQEQEIKGVKAQRENYVRLVEAKEAELEAALNNNDSKAVAKATKELSDAQMRANALLAYEEEREANYTSNTEDDTQNTQRPSNNSDVPQATLDWVERNPWFRTDGKKHMLARMVAKEVQDESKYTPDDDEFWDEVDERLQGFNIGKPQKKVEEKQNEPREQPSGRRKSPVGSRGGDEDAGGLDADFGTQFKRNGNRISATPTQSDTEMAERLGVDINSYMKEKFKYGNQGYKGYVNIDVPQ